MAQNDFKIIVSIEIQQQSKHWKIFKIEIEDYSTFNEVKDWMIKHKELFNSSKSYLVKSMFHNCLKGIRKENEEFAESVIKTLYEINHLKFTDKCEDALSMSFINFEQNFKIEFYEN